MRHQHGFIAAVALVLGLITVTGTVYTDRFPLAAHAESVGFDALAHDLFKGGLVASAADRRQVGEVGQASAQ